MALKNPKGKLGVLVLERARDVGQHKSCQQTAVALGWPDQYIPVERVVDQIGVRPVPQKTRAEGRDNAGPIGSLQRAIHRVDVTVAIEVAVPQIALTAFEACS